MKKRTNDTNCKYHQPMPYHTPQQAKRFFATGHELGFEADYIKDHAKKHFKKDCFNKITKEEMKWLIESLNRRAYDKGRKENERMGTSQKGAQA